MNKLPAGLKPSADYDDVTDDVINAKPSAESSARRRFIFLRFSSSADSFLLNCDDITADVIYA
ncbi:hypothetical protein F511_36271 [Dorcoceras hygrometricum]|uniref:Uncharacterized protein n=1 Tax=Dorcoceras hygrometricum TaxID=472368 RepID=A0A2Z6ZXK7_9LAMI|nr:hypothetical protein F511_47685 [Dorcoceras hygrometricum]KZV35796.1 hypothetical protein F511_36271 [Dorcoceras hygrometricum]